MDCKVEIKEKPLWLEGTANTSLENFELASDMIPLKQETKSELTEPVSTLKNEAFEGILTNNMEEPVFVKCEPAWSSDTEEPSNFESFEFVSEMIPLEQKTKSELAGPGTLQENSVGPSAYVKEEMFTEQHDLVPNIEEENKLENVAELTSYTEERSSHCKRRGELRAGSKKTLPQKSKLETRVGRKPGERPYYCQICESTFARRRDLRNHMVIHSGERPYSCERCSKTFTQRGGLSIHMRIHTGERPHRCDQCKKSFIDKSSLQYHVRRHTGDRPFCCVHCQKTFSHKSCLVSHMRTHTGERPYCCQDCNRSFAHRCNLLSHMLTHSGGLYCCERCGKTYTQKRALQKHVRRHTGENS